MRYQIIRCRPQVTRISFFNFNFELCFILFLFLFYFIVYSTYMGTFRAI